MKTLFQRKDDHIRICADEQVGFRTRSTLFQDVDLIHNALPELSLDRIDTGITLFGKRLAAPLLIASMSGGTPEAARLNEALARAAQRHRIGLALGSQSALLADPPRRDGFMLRKQAPDALLLGNIGAVRARGLSAERIEAELLAPFELDALCIHLNPAQELIQPEGDRDFGGCLDAIERLAASLPHPIIVKETGCGISRNVGIRLVDAGVRWVDVSGAGGTSWVGVETLRSEGDAASIGESLWDWGIPTAASLVQLSGLELRTIATGGMSSGLDVAKAIALGAHAVGVARPLLKAFVRGGEAGLDRAIGKLIQGLRMVMLLAGASDLDALRRLPWIPGPNLRAWMEPDTPAALRARLGI